MTPIATTACPGRAPDDKHHLALVRFGSYPKDYCYWCPAEWKLRPGDTLRVNAAGVIKDARVRRIKPKPAAALPYKVAVAVGSRASGSTAPDPHTTLHSRACANFKVGMLVKVLPKPTTQPEGWLNVWTVEMDLLVGTTQTIASIDPTYGIRFEGGDLYSYPATSLAAADVEPQSKALKALAGDAAHAVLFRPYGKIGTPPDQWDADMATKYRDMYRVIYPELAAAAAPLKPIITTSKETSAMNHSLKIETLTLVNGENVEHCSDSDIFNMISNAEKAIAELEKIQNKPKKLEARIEDLRTGITRLVEIVDAR